MFINEKNTGFQQTNDYTICPYSETKAPYCLDEKFCLTVKKVVYFSYICLN
jgi:hypothetical protein